MFEALAMIIIGIPLLLVLFFVLLVLVIALAPILWLSVGIIWMCNSFSNARRQAVK